jgi:hypothetical protein
MAYLRRRTCLLSVSPVHVSILELTIRRHWHFESPCSNSESGANGALYALYRLMRRKRRSDRIRAVPPTRSDLSVRTHNGPF